MGQWGKKEKKKCEFLKLNDKKIISFHLSKMVHKPNNRVKFLNFLSMNKKKLFHILS